MIYIENAKKTDVTLKINANFQNVRFTYIKKTRSFRKQCASKSNLREFVLIGTSQQMTYLKKKMQHFQSLFAHCYHVITL